MGTAVKYIILCAIVFLFSGCSKNRLPAEGEALIIYRSQDGRIITREELRKTTGKVSYEILSSKHVPIKAKRLHSKGRDAGAKGNYEEAISLFESASAIAPEWPYPIYDKAYTYLLMNDFRTARIYYNKTVELAPRGFFKAITALYTLNHEEEGAFPQGTYLRYLSIEWIEDPKNKVLAIEKLTEEIPTFAPAWLDLSGLLEDPDQRIAAIENGLSFPSDIETKGLLLISKAIVLNQKDQKDRAIKVLGEIILDPGSSILVEQLAKETLWFFLEEDRN